MSVCQWRNIDRLSNKDGRSARALHYRALNDVRLDINETLMRAPIPNLNRLDSIGLGRDMPKMHKRYIPCPSGEVVEQPHGVNLVPWTNIGFMRVRK